MCHTCPGELIPGNWITTGVTAVTDGVDSGMRSWNAGFRENATGRTVLVLIDQGIHVHVVEVVRRDDLRRVRGRIDGPVAGWVSLVNLDSGFRWALPEIRASQVIEFIFSQVIIDFCRTGK